MAKITSIDEYIATFPAEVQPLLEQVRGAIRKAAPEAEEAISYAIPTFKVNGKYLIYFSGAKKHIGIYPYSDAMNEAFPEATAYNQPGKGTIRFPLDKPLPLDLIAKIVKFRLKERGA